MSQSDKQKELLEIYGSFDALKSKLNQVDLDKQSSYELSIIKKIAKASRDNACLGEFQTLSQLNDNSGTWNFGGYRSKTPLGISVIIKSLAKTPVWKQFEYLREWYPTSDRLALVFKAPGNGYNDLVLLSSCPDWLEDAQWYIMTKAKKEDEQPVYILDFKEMLRLM